MPASLATRLVSERDLLDSLADVAIAAGAITNGYRGCCTSDLKIDGSPVTIADQEAEALILARLRALLPGLPIISEEAMAAGKADVPGRAFVLVDALDGTKEFLAGSNEFTVNIGFIEDGRPVGGILYAPALSRLWLAAADAETCSVDADQTMRQATDRRLIHARKAPENGLVAAVSRRHFSTETQNFLSRYQLVETRTAGSSLKFCLLAEGEADIYARFSPTMEWDTAAGHAILLAAGGVVSTRDGQPLQYGKVEEGYLNTHFIAVGDAGIGPAKG